MVIDQKLCLGIYLGPSLIGVIDCLVDYPKKSCCYIGLLLIRDDYHGNGYGRKSYYLLENYIQKSYPNTSYFRLGVIASNIMGEEFWPKVGFKKTGEIKESLTAVLIDNVVIYEKQLTPYLSAVSERTVAPYTWGDGCHGWYFSNSESLNVVLEKMPKGTFESKHLHRKKDQGIFVLEGEITIKSVGKDVRVSKGEYIQIPKMTPHEVKNCGEIEAQFLVLFSPGLRNDRVDLK